MSGVSSSHTSLCIPVSLRTDPVLLPYSYFHAHALQPCPSLCRSAGRSDHALLMRETTNSQMRDERFGEDRRVWETNRGSDKGDRNRRDFMKARQRDGRRKVCVFMNSLLPEDSWSPTGCRASSHLYLVML